MARRRRTRRKAERRGFLAGISASFGPAPKSVVRSALRHTRARPIIRKLWGRKS